MTTDRAKRYAANRHVTDDKRHGCLFCRSKRFLTVDHLSGDESDGNPANLAWLCKSCNTRKGAAFRKAGIGRLTHQYNPAEYQEVYAALNEAAQRERVGKRKRGKSSARTGVYRDTFRRYLKSLGWDWHPTMQIGSGCKVHLRADELPHDRLIVSLSGHLCAVIYGVVEDTHEPSRGGTRCVYGYWSKDSITYGNTYRNSLTARNIRA